MTTKQKEKSTGTISLEEIDVRNIIYAAVSGAIIGIAAELTRQIITLPEKPLTAREQAWEMLRT